MDAHLSDLVLLLSIGTQNTGLQFQWDEDLCHTEPIAGTPPPGVTNTRLGAGENAGL